MSCNWPGCHRQEDKAKYCNRHYAKLARCGKLEQLGRFVDATDARVRLDEHLSRGRSMVEVSRMSGVPERTLWNVKRCKYDHACKHTVDAIMALPLPPPMVGIPSRIGLVRRIQALMCSGFSGDEIAGGAKVPWGSVSGAMYHDDVPISVRNAVAVKEFFDAFPAYGLGTSSRTRAYARRKRWAPVGAWIGIDIDDPDSVPDFGDATDSEPFDEVDVIEIMAGKRGIDYTRCGKRVRRARDEAIRRFSTTHTAAWIGDRVGCTVRTVERVRAADSAVAAPVFTPTPWEQLVVIAREIAADLGPELSRKQMGRKLKIAGHGCGHKRLTRLMEILRTERRSVEQRSRDVA